MCKGGIKWACSDIWLLHGLVNAISNELFVLKFLIMIPIERFCLSTFSGCYRETASWYNECERAREEKEQEKEERKRIREEKRKEEIAKIRKAISSEENSDFDNGLDFDNEERLEDEFSDDNIKEDSMEEPESNAAVEEETRDRGVLEVSKPTN